MLLIVGDSGQLEARLSWRADDDRPRVRTWHFSDGLPGVGTSWFGKLRGLVGWTSPTSFDPAVLIAAPPEANADRDVPWDAWRLPYAPGTGITTRPEPIRLYLGGLTPGGKIGAVPFRIAPTPDYRVGPRSVAIVPAETSVEVRIVRRGGLVRYRWGRFPTNRTRLPRWTGGDVTLSAEEVAAPGDSPLLPGLTSWLRARGTSGNEPPHCRAVLELGGGVTYVDLLRAVECGEGDPAVVWVMGMGGIHGSLLSHGGLPVMPAEQEDVFEDALDIELRCGWLQLGIDEHGAARNERRELRAEELERYVARMADGGDCLRIQAHSSAPWSALRPVLDRARSMGLTMGFEFSSPEAPRQFSPWLVLHPADPAKAECRLVVGPNCEASIEVKGRTVSLEVPDGTTVERVLLLVARLQQTGARSIAFE